MTLPNFIVIGPGKTGTTWLYQCLAEHPQIKLARNTKETFFFNDYYGRGSGWYEKFFENCESASAIGEVSNTYFFSPEVPARIAARLPNVKLIAFLRNPVERLVSLYLFRRRNGLITGSLEDAIASDPTMVEQNFFDEHLARYLEFFPREQMFVALFDDLEADPRKLLGQIYRFLGVDADFVPPAAGQKVLAANEPRNAGSFHLLKRFALWLRRNDFHRLLTWAKTNPLVLKILTRPVAREARPVLEAETRARLLALYRPHMARAADLLGRDLGGWM